MQPKDVGLIMLFQTFFSELLVTKIAKKVNIKKPKNDKKTQLEMLKELELSVLDFKKIYNYCREKNRLSFYWI